MSTFSATDYATEHAAISSADVPAYNATIGPANDAAICATHLSTL